MTDEQMLRDISTISKALTCAWESRLETEMVYSALKAMKETPTLTIGEAITIGLKEWDLSLEEYLEDPRDNWGVPEQDAM